MLVVEDGDGGGVRFDGGPGGRVASHPQTETVAASTFSLQVPVAATEGAEKDFSHSSAEESFLSNLVCNYISIIQ